MKIQLQDGQITTFEEELGRNAFRHTASHILAQAVKRLYPQTKLAIGPAIADGFYYDFDTEAPLTQDDLGAIEAEMRKIVKEGLTLERFTLPKEEAIELVRSMGEPYKEELAQNLPEGATISFYRQGEFVDLCAGPHVGNTKVVKAIKLTSVAGAYWHGDEKNKMLTRIYDEVDSEIPYDIILYTDEEFKELSEQLSAFANRISQKGRVRYGR